MTKWVELDDSTHQQEGEEEGAGLWACPLDDSQQDLPLGQDSPSLLRLIPATELEPGSCSLL